MKKAVVCVSVLLVCMAAVFPGCLSRTTGNEGNLKFSFQADDRLLDFNKPVAVGAKLELKVAEAGNRKRAQVISAEFEGGAALGVVEITGDLVTVEGLSEGGGLLEVKARLSNGTEVIDSVNLLARVPEVLKLNHACVEGGEARYLVGQRILVPFEMERANGQPVIGFGFYPVSLDPAESMSFDMSIKAQQFMHLDTAQTPGTVTMSSDIDGATLTLVLSETAEIDGAELMPNLGALKGVPTFLYALPTVGGERICQAITELSVVSDTPEICDVAHPEAADDPEAPEGEFGFIKVTGKAVGKCLFTLTYPEANDGQGVSAQLEADIFDIERPTEE